MAYVTRTKDDPGDVGRAADQQQSIDNEELLYKRGGLVQLSPFGYTIPLICETGDGKAYLPIPLGFAGLSLVYCHGEVETAGVGGGPMTIQIHNVTQAVDMLSTLLSIDTAETGSDTAAAPYVIKANGDEVVAAYDILRIDFDAVHAAEAEGCVVTLGFG